MALKPRARELERAAANVAPPPAFGPALQGTEVGVIAEVKRRSPSAGAIQPGLDPVAHAIAYQMGGARVVSVLTEADHFGGSLEDLARVAAAVNLPVLRKDFILDELQLLEARVAGASAVLLIARALPGGRLQALAAEAQGLGLGTLIEVHTEAEVDQALAASPSAVGVNSRDLATFTIDLRVAELLVKMIPRAVPAVAESGIETRDDVVRMAAAGADLVLVGTALARERDPAGAVRRLAGVARRESERR
jgi:indole-3-glycerol phosphate synthase